MTELLVTEVLEVLCDGVQSEEKHRNVSIGSSSKDYVDPTDTILDIGAGCPFRFLVWLYLKIPTAQQIRANGIVAVMV